MARGAGAVLWPLVLFFALISTSKSAEADGAAALTGVSAPSGPVPAASSQPNGATLAAAGPAPRAAPVPVPTPSRGKLPADFQRSFTYADGNWCPFVRYSDPLSDISLANLRVQTHANWAMLLVTWFQDTMDTTDVYPHPQRTAKDYEIAHAVATAKQLGMKVGLKLHVDMAKNPDPKTWWRGNIGMHWNASSPELGAWFNSYRIMLRRYAGLAEALGIDMLVVGTELVALDVHDAQWRTVVADARALYGGQLSYAGNWWGDNIFGAAYTPLNITFWDTLDFIGIDAYFPMAKAGSNPSLEDLKRNWEAHIPVLEMLNKKYNKPIIFTELGYVSAQDNYVAPNKWDVATPVNFTAQAALYTAFFEAVAIPYSGGPGAKGDWFKGVHWWVWLTDPATGGEGDYRNLYTPQHKPALRVLRKYYSTDPPLMPAVPGAAPGAELTLLDVLTPGGGPGTGSGALIPLTDAQVALEEGLGVDPLCDGCAFALDKAFHCDVVAALS